MADVTVTQEDRERADSVRQMLYDPNDLRDVPRLCEAFAAHRAAERERCAGIVEKRVNFDRGDHDQQERAKGWRSAQKHYATAIRGSESNG